MEKIETAENVKGLDRYLSRLDVWGMAVGVMVGWGAFVMPGTTFLPVAGVAGTVTGLFIGMLVMLLIGLCISWLMRRNPQTGGVYSYTKKVFGRDHAFLCAWFLCLSYLTIVFLNGSALFVVIRTVMGQGVQTGYHYNVGGNAVYLSEIITSVLSIVIIGLLFILAKPILQKLQTILALILLACIILICIVCLPRALESGMLSSSGQSSSAGAFGIFSIVILSPWAFVGFEVTSFDTAHFRFSRKKTLGIMIASILAAGFAYITMPVVSVSAIPDGYSGWGEYFADLGSLEGSMSVPTFYAAETNMGKAGLVLVTVAALAAILTGIIGGYRAMVRVLSTMAEDKILSEKFSETGYSIVFIMVLSVLISLVGRNTLNWFVDLTAFGATVAYGYICASAYRTAKSLGNARMKNFGLAGAVISGILIFVQVVPNLAAMDAMDSEAFLLLSLWCLLGFFFYWRTIERSNLTEYSGMSTSGTVLFALLVYSVLMWAGKTIYGKGSMEETRESIIGIGFILVLIIITGLIIMLYIQNLVRKKHEASEREKIRAVEGSLAKSQFLFNMSHDIRTPMNAIIGYTTLAQKEDSMDVVQDYLTKIDTSSRSLLDLLNDLLEMSRIESGKAELSFAPLDICNSFREISDLFEDQMKQKNIDFTVNYYGVKDRYVWCDKKNLNRVLLNIISNAYKFTPEGGEVSAVLLETGDADDGYGSYEIHIKDNGIGMSREFVDRMFTAFERERTSTESGVEGTGLGLPIAKNIVDLMGGTIDVLTSPGSGTEFIIRLRMQLAEEKDVAGPAEGAEEHERRPHDFSGKRVLLVEDNMVNMEIAKMILEQLGLAVETAENGKVGVDMVAASEPGYYNAILMDIQMPVMDGYEATGQIRALDDEELAAIPILAMTANAFQEDIDKSRESGMQAHIAKPVDIAVLTEELANVLGV